MTEFAVVRGGDFVAPETQEQTEHEQKEILKPLGQSQPKTAFTPNKTINNPGGRPLNLRACR